MNTPVPPLSAQGSSKPPQQQQQQHQPLQQQHQPLQQQQQQQQQPFPGGQQTNSSFMGAQGSSFPSPSSIPGNVYVLLVLFE